MTQTRKETNPLLLRFQGRSIRFKCISRHFYSKLYTTATLIGLINRKRSLIQEHA